MNDSAAVSVEGEQAEADAPADTRSQARSLAPWVLGALLLIGLLVRVPTLDDEPPGFHTMRQLHSAQVARSLYEAMPGVDDVVRPPRPASIEPPVSEAIAAVAYWTTGGERLWIPRLLSSVYWLVGGAALFALLGRHGSLLGRTAGTIVYLLAPLAVHGGQSFQPDSLMVGSTLVSMWALTGAIERRSRRRWALGVVVGAFAVLVKPVMAPLLLAYVVGVTFVDGGFDALRRRSTLTTVAALVAPGAAFYAWQGLTSSEAQVHSSSSFLPRLFTETTYYETTFELIRTTLTLPVLLLALAAPFVASRRPDRIVTGALWLGYIAYNIPSNYRTATHNYYHLPLMVVAGFGVAVTISEIERRIAAARVGALTRTVVCALPLVLVGALAIDGVSAARTTVTRGDELIARDRQIGTVVGDGARVLAVTWDYGSMLYYYGNVEAIAYPSVIDRQLQRLEGRSVSTPAELIADSDADWFVATDLLQLVTDDELVDELATFKMVAFGDTWAVWSLREPAGG